MELKPSSTSLLVFPAILLIVPYGIETWKQPRYAKDGSLLIVPYGIETFPLIDLAVLLPSFNRTLWN